MEEAGPRADKKPQHHRSASEWREIVEEVEQQQQSPRSYCQATGVSYQQFLYWRKKFSNAENGELPQGIGSPFRALGLMTSHREYRLTLDNDLELSFPSGSDIKEIAALVKALGKNEL